MAILERTGIPNIGSVIAVLFPFFLSLLYFDSLTVPLLVLLLLGGIQMLMGNVIEPPDGITREIREMICIIRQSQSGRWVVREIIDGMEETAAWPETFKTSTLAIAEIKAEALRRKETRYGWIIE